MGVSVKAIGTVRLVLGSGTYLDLNNVYYIPFMKRNLISVSQLVKQGCIFFIDSYGIKISLDSCYIGSACLLNDYWSLECSYPKEAKCC